MSDGILAALRNVTAEDLTTVDARIDELTRELDCLREARKLISTRLNGKQKRKSPTRKSATPNRPASELAQRIYDLIDDAGSLPVSQIATSLGVKAAGVGKCVSSCDWFVRLPSGDVAIATTG